ncbi:MAG: bifunctional 2-C-methyl-D-erythritol 4-phosphate cytidylyltransferase/2-C-methyl-D-erythritol 2,4-cyclodiphosphate synthase, partial [Synergistaceae bacterium]|nr:bifunctional 2-C-methyl-D-erythritol 4-phosphate cytidylyltransferase/2-C-methyl-D-erythritol 2,4-cyclodiphosphate synthase [Synergistaceae bacterium]
MKSCSFLLVAAGKGSRAGGGLPKQLRLLGARPLWEWSARTAETLYRAGEIMETVLVVPPGMEEDFKRAAEIYD